jgi:hypothetical protein
MDADSLLAKFTDIYLALIVAPIVYFPSILVGASARKIYELVIWIIIVSISETVYGVFKSNTHMAPHKFVPAVFVALALNILASSTFSVPGFLVQSAFRRMVNRDKATQL